MTTTNNLQIGLNARLFPTNWRPVLNEIHFGAANGFAALQFPGKEEGLSAQHLGDEIIQENLMPWEAERKYGFKIPKIDHIDLIEVAPLQASLKPQMPIVTRAGAGVAVLRIALTDLVPTSVSGSVAGTLIPYAFIAEASSGKVTGRPAGSTPYLGETGMEMQFRDGATGAVLAECRDTEIGRKYAAELDAGAAQAAQTWANGYMSSFQSWGYAKAAFNKWSMLVAKRVAELQQIQPTQ
jgi:hypothetical protein